MAYGDPVPCKSCSKPITFEKKPDGEGYNRFNPDGSPHIDERKNGGGGYRGKSPEEQRAIARMSALKSAIDFVNGRLTVTGETVPTTDVLKIADAFVAWLEKVEKTP